jgi:hypothetical protein
LVTVVVIVVDMGDALALEAPCEVGSGSRFAWSTGELGRARHELARHVAVEFRAESKSNESWVNSVKKPNLAIEPVRSRRVKPTRFTRPPFSPSIGSRPVMVPTSFEER